MDIEAYAERFWALVDKRGQDECWPWKGRHDRHGYGTFCAQSVTSRAHRVPFILAEETIEGAEAHHLCGNKDCVNPSHVVMLTPSQHRLAHRKDLFHCKHGHPWTKENTIWRWPNPNRSAMYPNRQCRVCHRLGMGHRSQPVYWTKEACVEAIRQCAAEDKRTPRALDFNPGMARRLGFLESARRCQDRDWPRQGTIQALFGTWNNAVREAGFEPRGVGQKSAPARWRRMPDELKASTLT